MSNTLALERRSPNVAKLRGVQDAAAVAPVRIEQLSSRFPAGQRHRLTDADCRQFLFIHSGAASIELESALHPLLAGSIVVTPPGPEIVLQLEPGAEGIWVSLSELFFGSEVIRSMPGLAAHPMYWNETYYTSDIAHFFEGEDNGDARDLLYNELTGAAARLGMGCDPAVAAYTLVILFGQQWRKIVSTHRVALSDAQDLSESQLVSLFRQMVGLNFTKHFRVQQYCESMRVSYERLTSSCKTVLGLTPSQVIQQRMVLEAKRALLHSPKSISEISYDLGFSDVGYFSRFIRLKTGMSPRELRENNRALAAAS